MDTKAQMPEMQPGPEKSEGLQVLSFDELTEEQKDQIFSLEYNALDTEKKHNFEARKASIGDGKLYNEHLKESAHGDVLVALLDERVIGALTLNRENGVGVVDDIWLAGERHQKGVIAGLLERAKGEMRGGAGHCDSAVIQAPHPSSDIREVFHHVFDADSRRFFSIKSEDT